MSLPQERQPYELLDDGFAPDPCELLVIGCGNILRGDDAVGPVLVRHLHTLGVPDGVRLVDGGTSGMDVAFGMRGAARVVIVDAAATGAAPGTTYRVPAEQLAELPPIDGLHSHNFRWDHALSFSTWLLGPHRPTDITVYLIEAGQVEMGGPLSEPVEAAMQSVIDLIVRDHYPQSAVHPQPAVDPQPVVEITDAGNLHLPAALAHTYFPADVCVARLDGDELLLVPLVSAANGGLVLKQFTPSGDRSVLVSEVLGFASVAGRFPVVWDEERATLRVLLAPGVEGRGDDGQRGADRGGARRWPVDGVPAGPDARGGGPAPAADVPDAGQGAAGSGCDPSGGRPTAPPGGGPR